MDCPRSSSEVEHLGISLLRHVSAKVPANALRSDAFCNQKHFNRPQGEILKTALLFMGACISASDFRRKSQYELQHKHGWEEEQDIHAQACPRLSAAINAPTAAEHSRKQTTGSLDTAQRLTSKDTACAEGQRHGEEQAPPAGAKQADDEGQQAARPPVSGQDDQSVHHRA